MSETTAQKTAIPGRDYELKLCGACGQHKPRDGFHRLAISPDGRQGYCKACSLEYAQQWRASRGRREEATP